MCLISVTRLKLFYCTRFSCIYVHSVLNPDFIFLSVTELHCHLKPQTCSVQFLSFFVSLTHSFFLSLQGEKSPYLAGSKSQSLFNKLLANESWAVVDAGQYSLQKNGFVLEREQRKLCIESDLPRPALTGINSLKSISKCCRKK